MKALTEDWQGIDTIIIYGLGQVADRFIDKIIADFKVPYIIDQKKRGGDYKGIPILDYDSAKERKIKNKIVVFTSQRIYEDIKRFLENNGLKEYKDFCRIEQFAVEWYEQNRNSLNIIQLNTAVTTWCSLNCEKCNMFMPYYDDKDRKHYSFEEMKEDIDLILKYVDYVFSYTFLGGEPFLNKDLKRIIEYIAVTYHDKVFQLGIITNGTIIPDEETLEIIKNYHVTVSISDYTSEVCYNEKIDNIVGILEKNNISYTRNQMREWKDFGFPQNPFHWGKEYVKKHMKSCAPLCHGINDKKLFYCHMVWSADKAGIYKAPQDDYIDLTQLNCENIEHKKSVVDYCKGKITRGYLDFCMVCGGCGEDNNKIIKAGMQAKKEYMEYTQTSTQI